MLEADSVLVTYISTSAGGPTFLDHQSVRKSTVMSPGQSEFASDTGQLLCTLRGAFDRKEQRSKKLTQGILIVCPESLLSTGMARHWTCRCAKAPKSALAISTDLMLSLQPVSLLKVNAPQSEVKEAWNTSLKDTECMPALLPKKQDSINLQLF